MSVPEAVLPETPADEPIAASPAAPPKGGGLFGRIVRYGLSRTLTEGILALRGLALAALLGPAGFGAWALLRLLMKYVGFVSLGVFNGLEFELVQRQGQGGADVDRDEQERYARSTLGFVLAVFGAVAVVLGVASFVVSDPALALLLRGAAAGIIAEQVYAYGLVCIRARADLTRYAQREILHATLQFGCTGLFAWRWGLPGAFAGLVLASTVAIAIAPGRISLRPLFAIEPLRRLLAVGLPVAASTILAIALATGDQWVVAAIGGTTLLGYYAMATAVAGIGGMCAWIIRTVVFPDVYRHAREAGAGTAMRTNLDRTVRPFARLFPPLLGAMALGIGPALALFAPSYLEAARPARLFIFSGAALGIASLASVSVVATSRRRLLPLVSGAAMLLNLALTAAALLGGAGLEAVAAASLLSQTLFALAILGINVHATEMPGAGRYLAALFLPLGWCALAIVVLGRLWPGHDPRSVALSVGAYVVALLPLVPVIRRDVGVVRAA